MAGYQHSAFDTIGDLRRNLTDRYKDCYAVLKELIQNADDAKATELHVAFLESVPRAQHPLLQGPQILIINNGPFSLNDAAAIQQVGTGSKGHDASKIGKFGLGLKSVFHLCEAFFFISSQDDQDATDSSKEQYRRTDILNPWHPATHADWDNFDRDDQSLIRNIICQFLKPTTTDWFSLCLPLRKQAHCRFKPNDDPNTWAIEPKYYGEHTTPPTDIFRQARMQAIQLMLPLMSTLDTVYFWPDGPAGQSHAINRAKSEHVDWRNMTVEKASIAGEVTQHSSTPTTWRYAGIHEKLDNAVLSRLPRPENGWPHSDSQTSKGRERKPVEPLQHCGVVILEQEGSGSLRVDRAVFLPLGDRPHPECPFNSLYSYEIILHGYFFVDAGRLGVDFAPEGEAPTVRQQWNSILYDEGTLPLVIPALNQYAQSITHDSDCYDRIHDLTRFLYESPLWDHKQKQICRDATWYCRLRKMRLHWCHLSNKTDVVTLPGDGETDPALPFKVFPNLEALAEQNVVTFSGSPYLALSRPDSIPDDFIEILFQAIDIPVLVADDEQLTYLIGLVEDFSKRAPTLLPKVLLRFARQLVSQVPPNKLRARKASISTILSHLPQDALLACPHKRDLVKESDALYQSLLKVKSEVLPIPDTLLDETTKSTRALTLDDATRFLEVTADQKPMGKQLDAFQRLVEQTALSIMEACRASLATLHQHIGALALFQARDYFADQRVLCSLDQLQKATASGLLFGNIGIHCQTLQDCLTEDHVLYISQPDTIALIEELVGKIPACDSGSCINILGQGVLLTEATLPRATLLKALIARIEHGLPRHDRQSIRHLLHGSSTALDHDATLFIEQTEPWATLAAAILEPHDQQWRLIPTELTEDLGPAQLKILNVKPCSAQTMASLLQELGTEGIDCTKITDDPDVIPRIANDWPEDVLDSLRALPIFETVDGHYASLTRTSFVHSDSIAPPPEIFKDYTLIKDPTGTLQNRGLVRPCDPAGLVAAALALSDCHQHHEYIIQTLPNPIPDDLRELLTTKRWIPAGSSRQYAPDNVVTRTKIGTFVQRLTRAGKDIIASTALSEAVVDHPNWSLISDLCPSGEDLYKKLGAALQGVSDFSVGESVINTSNLEDFIKLFADITDAMPAAALFSKLQEGTASKSQYIIKHLVPAVKGVLPEGRLVKVLTHITDRHQESGRQQGDKLIEFFNRYLAEGLSTGISLEVLSKIKLLSQDHQWRSPSELTLSVTNISPSNVLHDCHHLVLQRALGDRLATSPQIEGLSTPFIGGRAYDEEGLRRSATLLHEYLAKWRDEEIPGDALAAVVAMLGDNDGYPEVFNDLRDKFPLATIRRKFSWIGGRDSAWNLTQRMAHLHFRIEPADAQTVEVTNLLGETFNAAVNSQVASIFDGADGRTYSPMPSDHRCHRIRLRRIDPSELTPTEKLRILGRTVQVLRTDIHDVGDEDFEQVWSQITEVGQLEIEIAQQLILKESQALLKHQLSGRQIDSLREIFDDWREIESQEITADKEEKTSIDKERNELLERLQRLLTNDPQTQNYVLDRIRDKLDSQSYNIASIPFELLQNADDAVVELETLCEDPESFNRCRPTELRTRFIIEAETTDDGEIIRFIHWGRCINQFRIGGRNGKRDGFHQDMERMLILQGSGKNHEQDAATCTGKFGLGFKSVFFVTDSPRVFSGTRSRFFVQSGIFPVKLPEHLQERFGEILGSYGDSSLRGTIIECPVRNGTTADSVLDTFEPLANLIMVFARRLNQCTLVLSDGTDANYSWSPRSVTTFTDSIETGRITLNGIADLPVLVFRLDKDAYNAVLFALGPQGFDAQPLRNVPETWVTLPTKERASRGLLINADFDLNPGRTQLRDTDENKERSLMLGQELGGRLCELFQACAEDWTRIGTMLGIDEDSSVILWKSLWDVCIAYVDDRDAHQVTHQILFGSEHSGIIKLISECDALPTGLGHAHYVLTNLHQVKWILKGILNENDVWNAVSRSSWANTEILPGAVVSFDVGTALRKTTDAKIGDLTLLRVLEKTLDDETCVTSKMAADLNQIVPAERLRLMKTNQSWQKEEEQIRELLSHLKFKSRNDQWSRASDLLAKDVLLQKKDHSDELLRAAFAPDNHLLGEDYQDGALEFFLTARRELHAPAELLSQWIIAADSPTRRKAALTYLLLGQLSRSVEQHLRESRTEVASSWLADQKLRDRAMPSEVNERARVLSGIGLTEEIKRELDQLNPATRYFDGISRDPREVLSDILGWWRENKTDILNLHDRNVYPGGHAPKLSFSASQAQLEEDRGTRQPWLILFLRAAMFKIGRTQDHQSRGFLELCDRNDWLDRLADPSSEPLSWFQIMDDYLDNMVGGSEYYLWMNHFLSYYQIARWLPRYARSFEAVTRPGVDLTKLHKIEDLTNLRRSHIFSGATGFDAPPCKPTLGIGAHFALRETLRLRIGTDPKGHPISTRLRALAFFPIKRVRELLYRITDEYGLIDPMTRHEEKSRLIAHVLERYLGEDAQFDGCFDIPLMMLCSNPYGDDRERILGPDDGPDPFIPDDDEDEPPDPMDDIFGDLE